MLALGVVLFLVSLTLYESWDSRAVLGRWSRGYVAFMLACAAGGFSLLAAAFWRRRRAAGGARTHEAWASACFSGGVFIWGLSCFLAALDSSAAAARILDLNLVGAVYPPSAALDWLALTMLIVAFGLVVAPRLPSRWHNLALVGASVIVVLTLCEGIARARAVIAPQTQGFPTHSQALWLRRHVVLNDAGQRDIEHAPPSAVGGRRLLIVGDSLAFGWGISDIANRFGEQLVPLLEAGSGQGWHAVNAGRPDTHTLQHIETLQRTLDQRSDLVILLYFFNDIDYLAPVTPRPDLFVRGGIWSTLHPQRLLFLNSYLFQEFYVRWRASSPALAAETIGPDPYEDDALLAKHMRDLARFVQIARTGGTPALIVPMDISITASERRRQRLDRFLQTARAHGLPVCAVEAAFEGHRYPELRVNALDGHPNELANLLIAKATAGCALRAARPGSLSK